MNDRLKKWLIDNGYAKAEAGDDELNGAVGKAFADGKLTPQMYTELTTDEKKEAEVNQFGKQLSDLGTKFDKMIELMTPKEETTETKEVETKTETKEAKTETTETTETKEESGLTKAVMSSTTDARVKRAHEQYDDTKSGRCFPKEYMPRKGDKAIRHPFADEPMVRDGCQINTQSELDKAAAGAFAQWKIQSLRFGNPKAGFDALSDHSKDLLDYVATKREWVVGTAPPSGSVLHNPDDKSYMGYPDHRGGIGGVKQLIDDALSGGFEAAPIVFDDAVIEVPLVYGELYPFVNEISIARGRRIEGVSIGTVTGVWGGVDATAIAQFNTAGYVAAFDTTIYRWQGSVLIGLDFLSDSPINFGQIVARQFGERLLEDLDDVIATGNGATQPQGVMNSGATLVAFGAATNLANYEALKYAVHYRELQNPAMKRSARFCGTWTSFGRAKGIPVGGTDTRRVWDTNNTPDYDDRRIMGYPYANNESLTNQQIFFAVLGHYRMYRRKGFTLATSMQGQTLMLANEILTVVMARYGGQMERAACASRTTTAPA